MLSCICYILIKSAHLKKKLQEKEIRIFNTEVVMKILRKFLELEGKFKNLSIKMETILLKVSYAKKKLYSF